MTDDALTSCRTDFIELMGVAMEGHGMPRIAGRIIGLLIFDERTYAFGELATELSVSRASISSNTRMLMDRGIIEKWSRPGDRQDYFRITEGHQRNQLRTISQRMEKTSSDIRRIAARLPKDAGAAHERLERHALFFSAFAQGLNFAAHKVSSDQGATD